MENLKIGSPEWLIADALGSLDHQSKEGGSPDPNKKSEKLTGPFWPRKRWATYCERVRKVLTDNGYPKEKIEEAFAKASESVKFLD